MTDLWFHHFFIRFDGVHAIVAVQHKLAWLFIFCRWIWFNWLSVLVNEQHRGKNYGSLMHLEIQDEHRHRNRERRLEVLKIHDGKHNRLRREDRRNNKFGDSSSIKDRKRRRSKVNDDGASKEKTAANASGNQKRRESCGNNRGDKKSDSSRKYESQKSKPFFYENDDFLSFFDHSASSS